MKTNDNSFYDNVLILEMIRTHVIMESISITEPTCIIQAI